MLTPLTLAGLALVAVQYVSLAFWTRALQRYRLRVCGLEDNNGKRF